MPKPPAISESEWLVASVVWTRDALTATEIAKRLPGGVKWKLKTVNTFLARLVKKGVLDAERDGRAFRYYTRIPQRQCIRAESRSFLRRVFGGAIAPMFAHFCETENLTAADVAALRRILNRTATKKSPSRKS